MAFLYRRKQKGSVYYYVRETGRVKGKVKVTSQVYLGTIESILRMKESQEAGLRPVRSLSFDFGSLWMFTEIDRQIDIASIVDGVIPRGKNETGPTVGEYVYYTVMNRCIDPKSKNALAEWYQGKAIQFIRPVKLSELTSSRYWDKWDRVTQEKLDEIIARYLKKIKEEAGGYSDCFLFDTTNEFTYFSNNNRSKLAKRGKNKAGKHHLRQIGFALVIDRTTQLPVYFILYEGNMHDSKVFSRVIPKLIQKMREQGGTKQSLTIVFDKGMNSPNNIHYIDGDLYVHFVTSYSTYYVNDLVAVNIAKFRPLNITKNERCREKGKGQEQVLVYRTKRELWDKERAVLVTYNPRTARKKAYSFQKKLDHLRSLLLEYRAKVNAGEKHWRKEKPVRERYLKECERLHISSIYYNLSFHRKRRKLTMGFRKDIYQERKSRERFGKNIIVTDNLDWGTEEIYTAYQDRNYLEHQFRQSKSPHQAAIIPTYHWTDSKLRVFHFTCVVALSYLRLLEIRLSKAGIPMTAQRANEIMKTLHTSYVWPKGKRNPIRMVDEPTAEQNVILNALGYTYKDGCALQTK